MLFKKLSDFVIKYKYIILIVFAVILVLSLVGTVLLANDSDKINSDLMSYLTEDFDTTQGLAFMKENFGISGNTIMVVRGSEKDEALIASVEKIKEEYTDGISQFIWVEDVDSLELIQEQLSDIDLEDLEFLNDEDIQKLLEDEGLTSLAPNLQYLANISGILSMDINTEELSSYLKRDVGDGYYDYVMLIMTNYASSSSASYSLLDNMKAELLSSNITVNGVETERVLAAAGMAENSQIVTNDIYADLPNFLFYAVLAVIIILLLTSSSFIEPLILAFTLGISILISMGINYLYPSISIISYATSSILQLAITMDYAIFYMHTYKLKRKTLNSIDATKSAIPEVAPSILASGLTTVGGFVALYFMRFGIGSDIANVIVKGIVLSILCVLLLQPVLTLLLDKVILKTTHNFTKNINSKISKKHPDFTGISKDFLVKPIAKFSIWQRIILIALAIILIVPAYIGQSQLSYSYFILYEQEITTTEQQYAAELGNQMVIAVPLQTKEGYTQQDFIDMLKTAPYSKVGDVIGAFTSISNVDTDSLIAMLEIMSDEEGISDMQSLIDGLADSESSMYSIIETYIESNYEMSLEDFDLEQYNLDEIDLEAMLGDFNPAILKSYFAKVGDNWYTMYTITINGSTEDDEAIECYEYLSNSMDLVFGKDKTYSIGMLTGSYDMMSATPTDFMIVTLVSVGIILLIVALMLRNPLKSLIMVILIELGIWINFSITYLMGEQINFMIYIIISSIQLGCTVDYSILLANSFEKNRGKYNNSKECAYNSAIESVPAIFTSAIIIITVCMVVYFVSENIIIKQLTGMLSRGSAISFILVTFIQTAIMSFYKNQKKKVNYEEKLKQLETSPSTGKTAETDKNVSTGNVSANKNAINKNASNNKMVATNQKSAVNTKPATNTKAATNKKPVKK